VPGPLRAFVVASGLAAALLFMIVAAGARLQMYGDGSLFSYAVAMEDGWGYHWHNIAARAAVWLIALWPAERYVGLTGDAAGGIALYGVLFNAVPLAGLGLAFILDRSPGRLIFLAGCGATATVLPLVLGFPTELWMAHALFWPALAAAHYAPRGVGGAATVAVLLAALAFTHEGALVFAAALLASLLLRGARDPRFLRGLGAAAAVGAAWLAVKRGLPPEPYYAPIFARAAYYLIDPANLGEPVFRLLGAALAAYAILGGALRRAGPAVPGAWPGPWPWAAAAVALALGAWWWRFDTALHAESRYAARTALLLATPVLGGFAAACALRAEGALRGPGPRLARLLAALLDALARRAGAAAIGGALALVMLVEAVEDAKFVVAWTGYEAGLRALATGAASDPDLGDPHFVSAERLGPALNRMSWNSTTLFLSVLVAPGFAPRRLVIDPRGNYFWLSCAAAERSEAAAAALPREGRRLVRLHACLHR
jgi:hypothetical protein